MLLETAISFLKINIFNIFLLLLWLSKGKELLKSELAKRVDFDPKLLPYNQELLDFLKKQNSHLVLATASNRIIAEKIASHLGIFHEVLASDKIINLKGKNKLEVLNQRFGEGNYVYCGDSNADLSIFMQCKDYILVNPSESVKRKAIAIKPPLQLFEYKKPFFKSIFKQIRVYQWIKNILLFFPPLLAHATDAKIYSASVLAFFAFSFTASAIYVLNDLFDLDSDRAHPRKKFRPLAAGDMSIAEGILSFVLLLSSSFFISIYLLPLEFSLILLFYFISNLAYSFKLKSIYIVDIVILASLYSLRIYAGSLAVNVPTSKWLLAFSMFIFLSLAFLKRYTELLDLKTNNKEKAKGRGYSVSDISLVQSFGTAAGLLSILVYTLYIESSSVSLLYKRPEFLYLISPLLLIWISRLWFKASRGFMHDDPIVFTAKDKVSYLIIGLSFILALGATI
jgi:4-hydroxybenzoate polyprenyltransferase